MTVVQLREPPAILEEWLERRRVLGQDGYDEVWNGVHHVAPMARGEQGALQDELAAVLRSPARAAGLRGSGPVNIGDSNDYRVPDYVWFRTRQRLVWFPTAAIVAEIVSPGDESREKLGFYFDRGVDEVLVVDPGERTVEWYVRGAGGFVAAGASALLGMTAAQLHEAVDWP